MNLITAEAPCISSTGAHVRWRSHEVVWHLHKGRVHVLKIQHLMRRCLQRFCKNRIESRKHTVLAYVTSITTLNACSIMVCGYKFLLAVKFHEPYTFVLVFSTLHTPEEAANRAIIRMEKGGCNFFVIGAVISLYGCKEHTKCVV